MKEGESSDFCSVFMASMEEGLEDAGKHNRVEEGKMSEKETPASETLGNDISDNETKSVNQTISAESSESDSNSISEPEEEADLLR